MPDRYFKVKASATAVLFKTLVLLLQAKGCNGGQTFDFTKGDCTRYQSSRACLAPSREIVEQHISKATNIGELSKFINQFLFDHGPSNTPVERSCHGNRATHNYPSAYLKTTFFKAIFDVKFQHLVIVCEKCEHHCT
jgi:hypothetical protein